jgi:uncharacterized protein YndB with AHSA1/START domain
MSAERRIEVEVEVPATPEQAWEAIATGPGITAWFMPAEVEGRIGGSIALHQEGFPTSLGKVTAYDAPHRFAYEEESPLGEDEPGTQLTATEFLVEARSGGTCVVRVVMSGFGEGEAWERAIESFSAGWRQALLSLRLYLTHFRGEPVASVNAGVTASGSAAAVWSELTGALGLPARPRTGERVATTAPGAPELAGRVEKADDRMLTLVLDQPARGLGFVGAGGPGEQVYAFVRAQLFGPDAAEIAAREQEAWNTWLAQVPATTA